MEILRMNESHVDGVAALEKLCFSDPWPVAAIMPELTNPLSLWLVAVEDGQVIGYVGSQSVMGWSDMMNLAVAAQYRRQGIAGKLVMELITQLKLQQVTCLTLEVRASNEPAISLYTRLGFCEVGRRPNYYYHPREDALILRKEW